MVFGIGLQSPLKKLVMIRANKIGASEKTSVMRTRQLATQAVAA